MNKNTIKYKENSLLYKEKLAYDKKDFIRTNFYELPEAHQMGGTSHLTEKKKKNDPDRKDILG